MSDIGLAASIERLILTMPGSPVPQSTVATNGANAGATSVTLASTAGFVPDAGLSFADALGEEPIKITSVTNSTQLALTFTDLGYAGLQYTHTAGTIAYCCLQSEKIVQVGSVLNSGKPFIWVHVDAEDRGVRAVRVKGSSYTVEIGYHRALEPRSGNNIDPNTFYRRQVRAARTDMESIASALDGHWQLVQSGQQRAVKLGAYKSTRPYIRKRWSSTVRRVDTLQLVAVLSLEVESDWNASITP